jgi:hypothetical protein
VCCRELEDAAKRNSQQQQLLNSRIAELDAEGRKLRDQKYQLDTQVGCLVHGSKLTAAKLKPGQGEHACAGKLGVHDAAMHALPSAAHTVLLPQLYSCWCWCFAAGVGAEP